MRAFADLTDAGRNRRLRLLAIAALEHYPVEAARVRLAASKFNTTFRVDTVDRRRYALRVGAALRLHAPGIAEAEAVWTAALRRDTELDPPQIIRARDAAASVEIAIDGVPEPRECVLFTWRDGTVLAEHVRPKDVRAVGAVLATLHEHGATFREIDPRHLLPGDRVLPFDDPPRIAGHDPLFAEALECAQQHLATVWRDRGAQAHVLHGDLHAGNLLRNRGRLVPLDFQDALWSLEVQDIAITLTSLKRLTASRADGTSTGGGRGGIADAGGNGHELLHAFERGYRERRPWPVDDPALLSLFEMTRLLTIANLALNLRHPGWRAYVDDIGVRVRRWMLA